MISLALFLINFPGPIFLHIQNKFNLQCLSYSDRSQIQEIFIVFSVLLATLCDLLNLATVFRLILSSPQKVASTVRASEIESNYITNMGSVVQGKSRILLVRPYLQVRQESAPLSSSAFSRYFYMFLFDLSTHLPSISAKHCAMYTVGTVPNTRTVQSLLCTVLDMHVFCIW